MERSEKLAKVKITPHELRHSFVSIAGRSMDLKSLQAVLGHTSSTMTLDLNRHMIDGDLDRAADVVDQAAAAIGLGPKGEIVGITRDVGR